jgi:hypothetical protein
MDEFPIDAPQASSVVSGLHHEYRLEKVAA